MIDAAISGTAGIVIGFGCSIFVGLGTPFLLNYLTQKNRAEEKEQDYKRQDELRKEEKAEREQVAAEEKAEREQVAAEAKAAAELTAQAARDVARKAEEAAELLLAANELIAERDRIARQKLESLEIGVERVHTLVNSDKTAAMQRDLDGHEEKLVLLREIVDLKHAAGGEPQPQTLGAIAATEQRILALHEELAERHRLLALAEKQADAATADAPPAFDGPNG
jgi:multidrug efflux pump subunit AcrA (membrane-fusion protein)